MLTCRFYRAAFWSVVASFTVAGVAFAQPPSVDWKFYGGAKLDEQTVCFYDAKGITRRPGNHIRVWTKCLRRKDVDGVDIKKEFGGSILENTARKVASHYVPPITAVETINTTQSMTITQYEETANIGNIEPQASIFYELNCPELMMRELSISIQTGGKSGFRDKPGDWEYTPPEGNGARLMKILCAPG